MEILFITIATMTFQLALCFIGFLERSGPLQGFGDIMKVSTNDRIDSTNPNMKML